MILSGFFKLCCIEYIELRSAIFKSLPKLSVALLHGDGSIFQSVSLCNNCHILEQKKLYTEEIQKKSSKVYKSGRVFLQKKVTSYLGRYLKLPKKSMIGYAIMHALYVVF